MIYLFFAELGDLLSKREATGAEIMAAFTVTFSEGQWTQLRLCIDCNGVLDEEGFFKAESNPVLQSLRQVRPTPSLFRKSGGKPFRNVWRGIMTEERGGGERGSINRAR